jgi:hypothetical protein
MYSICAVHKIPYKYESRNLDHYNRTSKEIKHLETRFRKLSKVQTCSSMLFRNSCFQVKNCIFSKSSPEDFFYLDGFFTFSHGFIDFCIIGTIDFCPLLAALVDLAKKISSPDNISLYLSPSPCKLSRQSCRVACLLISVFGCHICKPFGYLSFN